MHPDECRSTHLLLLPPTLLRSITWRPVKVNNLHTIHNDPPPSTQSWERFAKSFQSFSFNFPSLSFSSKNSLRKIHSPLRTHTRYIINLPIILLIPQSILTHSHHPSSVNSPSNPSPTESRCSSPRGPLPFSDSGRIVSLGATHWMDAETEQHREHRRSCVIDTVARTGKDPSGPSLTSSLGRGREESSPAGDAGRQGSANQGCFSSPTTSHG